MQDRVNRTPHTSKNSPSVNFPTTGDSTWITPHASSVHEQVEVLVDVQHGALLREDLKAVGLQAISQVSDLGLPGERAGLDPRKRGGVDRRTSADVGSRGGRGARA